LVAKPDLRDHPAIFKRFQNTISHKPGAVVALSEDETQQPAERRFSGRVSTEPWQVRLIRVRGLGPDDVQTFTKTDASDLS
jgi:hypothetical protein